MLTSSPIPSQSLPGMLFPCSDQRMGKPLKTRWPHAAPQMAVSCNQIRTGKACIQTAMHGLFKMPCESRLLPSGASCRVRSKVTFILARTGTRRDHSNHLICLAAQWREVMSITQPSLKLSWGFWARWWAPETFIFAPPSPSLHLPIGQGSKSWMKVSEEDHHKEMYLSAWLCLRGVPDWGGMILMQYWPLRFPDIYF